MNKLFLLAITVLLLSLCSNTAYAQQPTTKYESSKFRSKPVWIEMMNDPEANYFETLKAFREFWRGYKLPGEPEELERNDSFEKEVGLEDQEEDKDKEREKKRVRKSKEAGDYSFEVKQFKGWFRDVQPWVQQDGHILSQEERQKLIDSQQNALKEIERNQKN